MPMAAATASSSWPDLPGLTRASSVSFANQRSVSVEPRGVRGVKCRWTRGCRRSHRLRARTVYPLDRHVRRSRVSLLRLPSVARGRWRRGRYRHMRREENRRATELLTGERDVPRNRFTFRALPSGNRNRTCDGSLFDRNTRLLRITRCRLAKSRETSVPMQSGALACRAHRFTCTRGMMTKTLKNAIFSGVV
jgi:hypothetical protein